VLDGTAVSETAGDAGHDERTYSARSAAAVSPCLLPPPLVVVVVVVVVRLDRRRHPRLGHADRVPQ